MMIATAKHLATQDIQGIKIHLLHVTSDSKLVKMLNEETLTLLTKEEYIDIVVDQLELLPPEVVIHRLTGDAPFKTFIGPIWAKKKTIVLNDIDKEFKKRNSYQGIYYDHPKSKKI